MNWRSDVQRAKRLRLVLILALELYLALTVVGFFFGPFAKNRPHAFEVVFFVVAYQTALLAGFLMGERLGGTASRGPVRRASRRMRPTRALTFWIFLGASLSIVFSYTSLAAFTGVWNPTKIVLGIFQSLADPGASYLRNRDGQNVDGSIVTTLSTLLAPVWFVALPLGIFFWRDLGWKLRLLVLVDAGLQLSTAVIRGMNFGVFRVAVVFMAVALVLSMRSRSLSGNSPRGAALRPWLTPLVAAGGFLLYFAVTTSDRVSQSLPPVIAGIPVNYNAGLMHLIPEGLKLPATLVFLYTCQGYYGFTHVFEIPFQSTFGLGSGRFLSDNVRSLTGVDLYPRTYVHRMESVWNETQNWHTAYTWFANDVSPWGVICVILLLGVLFNLVLRGALSADPLAVAVLPLYLLMVLFLPMNNVVISNPLTCMPFVVLTLAYLARLLRPLRRRSER